MELEVEFDRSARRGLGGGREWLVLRLPLGALGPLGMRTPEPVKGFSHGVGAVTITFVGPFMMTLTLLKGVAFTLSRLSSPRASWFSFSFIIGIWDAGIDAEERLDGVRGINADCKVDVEI